MNVRRTESLEAFWPSYLMQHRSPTSRALHFVGTLGFGLAFLGSLLLHPGTFGLAIIVMSGLLYVASRWVEPKRPAVLPGILILLVGAAGAPDTFPVGVIIGYGFAWLGHFVYERNSPASSRYPVWSFICDVRLCLMMASGRLWTEEGSSVVTRG